MVLLTIWTGSLCSETEAQCSCVVLGCFSYVQLFVTLCTVACHALLSMGFSRQKCWCGLLYPSPGDLPAPGMKLVSHISCVGCWVFTISTTWEVLSVHNCSLFKPEAFPFLIYKVLLPQADQEIKNSCVQLFVTPCTVAPQVPWSMELSRQEYWSGLPFPSPGERIPRRAK